MENNCYACRTKDPLATHWCDPTEAEAFGMTMPITDDDLTKKMYAFIAALEKEGFEKEAITILKIIQNMLLERQYDIKIERERSK